MKNGRTFNSIFALRGKLAYKLDRPYFKYYEIIEALEDTNDLSALLQVLKDLEALKTKALNALNDCEEDIQALRNGTNPENLGSSKILLIPFPLNNKIGLHNITRYYII